MKRIGFGVSSLYLQEECAYPTGYAALAQHVLKWRFPDIMNQDLYKSEVQAPQARYHQLRITFVYRYIAYHGPTSDLDVA